DAAAGKLLHRLRQAGSAPGRVRREHSRAPAGGRASVSRLQARQALRPGHFGRPRVFQRGDRGPAHCRRPHRLWRHGRRAKAGAEQAILGARLDDPATWAPALAAVDADFTSLTDMRASAAYRTLVARNLLRKALTEIAGTPVAEMRVLSLADTGDAAAA